MLRFVTDHRSGWLVHLARVVSDVGAVGVLGALAVIAGITLWFLRARLVVALTPAIALGVAGVCAAVVKQLVGRARPPVGLRLVHETEASFPSGHTTDSTAVLVAVALVLAVCFLDSAKVRALAVAGAGLLAAAIGGSRLELGVHWPTDVLAGYALGLAIAVTVTTVAVLVSRVSPPSADPSHRHGRLLRLMSIERQAPSGFRHVEFSPAAGV